MIHYLLLYHGDFLITSVAFSDEVKYNKKKTQEVFLWKP